MDGDEKMVKSNLSSVPQRAPAHNFLVTINTCPVPICKTRLDAT